MPRLEPAARWLPFGASALGLLLLLGQLTSHGLPGGAAGIGAAAIPDDLPPVSILVFSKTAGYRHEEAIPAANAMFRRIARERGWGLVATEDAALFQPDTLSRFAAVVFNNVSGDVFTPAQRQALEAYVEAGGGFVGFHGSGGDPHYDWQWYVRDLIGAQFIGHPMDPQFQMASLDVEDHGHPATATLPDRWSTEDEWYAFEASPRPQPGLHVLMTLDETSYANKRVDGRDLAMGEDHPVAWWHCVGEGRVFYSALGHQAKTYSEPNYIMLLAGATAWATRQSGSGCD